MKAANILSREAVGTDSVSLLSGGLVNAAYIVFLWSEMLSSGCAQMTATSGCCYGMRRDETRVSRPCSADVAFCVVTDVSRTRDMPGMVAASISAAQGTYDGSGMGSL